MSTGTRKMKRKKDAVSCFICGGQKVEPKMCRKFSANYHYNGPETAEEVTNGCYATRCESKYRICWVCALQGDLTNRRIHAETGLCSFHLKFGQIAQRPKGRTDEELNLDESITDEEAEKLQRGKSKKKPARSSRKKGKKPKDEPSIESAGKKVEKYQPPYDGKTSLMHVLPRVWYSHSGKQLAKKLGGKIVQKPISWWQKKSPEELNQLLKPLENTRKFDAAVRLVIAEREVTKESVDDMVRKIQMAQVVELEDAIRKIEAGRAGKAVEADPENQRFAMLEAVLSADRKLKQVLVAEVTPFIGQPRTNFDPDKMRTLQESIATIGLQEPIRVTPIDDDKRYKYKLIHGERRHRAHTSLMKQNERFSVIWAIVETGAIRDEEDLFELSLIANVCREDLSPMEKALGLKRIQARRGYAVRVIAKIMGMSHLTAMNYLKIANKLLPDVLAMMSHSIPEGERLNMNIAVGLTSVPIEHQLNLANEIVKEGLNISKATRLIKNFGRQKGFEVGTRQGRVAETARVLHRMLERQVSHLSAYLDVSPDEFGSMCRAYGEVIELQKSAATMRKIVDELNARIIKALPEKMEGEKLT